MPRKTRSGDRREPLYEAGILKDMHDLVLKGGRANKAIQELSGIEQRIERETGTLMEEDFEAGVREQKFYAGVIVETVGEMIDILDMVEAKVVEYRRRVA